GLEEGDRPGRRGPGDPDLRGSPSLMALKKFKPTSPGRRFMTVSSFDEITKSEPEKSLTAPLKKTGGRNVNGRITTRHQGGGHKRRYRIIDFKRRKDGIPAKVAAIEYDPNGSAMNPVDHPHGGGEGKSKGGRHPVTPWGVPTLGKRTRSKNKESDRLIVRARRRGKEKRK